MRAIDVQTMGLPDAELAYLSACSTASGNAKLLDDPVHVTAAFHIAGFRQVIGTQWAVNDRVAKGVAVRFHDRLTNSGTASPDTGRSAAALNAAVREPREAFPLTPSLRGRYLRELARHLARHETCSRQLVDSQAKGHWLCRSSTTVRRVVSRA
ncbi:CHAT domain-containing protein [Streptomyces chartreusis]|uniref:CHAT domain-containing protein n=1 Tax=Streptomyces chartreusis TaxID=1969 RepID=UPI0038147145